jgi:hypothetical protein
MLHGVGPSRAVVVGAVFAVLFLVLAILPTGAAVVMTVVTLGLMLVYTPDDPGAVAGLPWRGWGRAWFPIALSAVITVVWYGFDALRYRLGAGSRR